MKQEKIRLVYPENAYCAIFDVTEYPDLPIDAEETLQYFLDTFPKRESEMFLLKYKHNMTYLEINKKYKGPSQTRIGQIIKKVLCKFNHNSRIEVVRNGREAYLNIVVAANEEKKKHYHERIAFLEELIQNQNIENAGLQDKMINLEVQILSNHDILDSSIDVLKLSTRVWNCLNDAAIYTLKDIRDCEDLKMIIGMGRVGIKEIQDKMEIFLGGNK